MRGKRALAGAFAATVALAGLACGAATEPARTFDEGYEAAESKFDQGELTCLFVEGEEFAADEYELGVEGEIDGGMTDEANEGFRAAVVDHCGYVITTSSSRVTLDTDDYEATKDMWRETFLALAPDAREKMCAQYREGLDDFRRMAAESAEGASTGLTGADVEMVVDALIEVMEEECPS